MYVNILSTTFHSNKPYKEGLIQIQIHIPNAFMQEQSHFLFGFQPRFEVDPFVTQRKVIFQNFLWLNAISNLSKSFYQDQGTLRPNLGI